VVIPQAMHAVYVEDVGMTFPNIEKYLRLFGISVDDVPVGGGHMWLCTCTVQGDQ